MKRKYYSGLFIIVLSAVVCAVGYADVRTENVDMYLVLDKSLSMVEEIDDVKNYVVNELVKDTLIPGDTFKIIAFYGHADRVVSTEIDNLSASSIIEKIEQIRADGSYTDIGNALDALKNWLSEQPSSQDDNRRKYLLLLTDGIQEAPPGSIYHVDDMSIKSVNHAYLENVKEIKRKGWSIHILGIGRESDAKAIAESLSASYEIVDTEKGTDGAGAGAGNDGPAFSSRQILAGAKADRESIRITSMKARGGKIKMEVSAEFVDAPIDINVSDIVFDTGEGSNSILKNQVLFTLEPDEVKKVEFPIEKKGLAPGKYEGTVNFVFDSAYAFSPASFPVELKVNSFLENNLLWMVLVCLLLAGVILFIVIIVRNASSHKESEPAEKVDIMKTIIR